MTNTTIQVIELAREIAQPTGGVFHIQDLETKAVKVGLRGNTATRTVRKITTRPAQCPIFMRMQRGVYKVMRW